jgi:tetratricopeptide (TPR) repeat protein
MVRLTGLLREREHWRHRWACLLAATALLCASGAALAADPDLARADALLREGRYQEVYDLLSPFAASQTADARFNYLLGRAAIETKRLDQAKALLERALAINPDSSAARLALGRAYFALGQFAEAKIEFETVLNFDNLPPDLESQAQIYNDAALQYLEGKRWLPFGYAEMGIGHYRTNSNQATDFFGGARSETFYLARVGGGVSYVMSDDYTADGSLDYRFRYYDNEDTRNDSDVRWRAAITRALGENNLTGGLRGRVSYRGNGTYRNDYGVFGQWRYRLDEDNQFTVGAELRRRQYQRGNLQDRSRTIAEMTAGWIRSLFDGSASLSLVAHGGYQYATNRPDGNSTIYGLTATFDFTLTEKVGGFIFGWWEHDKFNIDRIHFHPDAIEGLSPNLSRKDNMYEFGGGLVWEFAKGWSLRPEILYILDDSNVFSNNYSSTEVWVSVRKGF